MKILLKGGRVLDPSQNLDGNMDILVNDGLIEAVEKDILKNKNLQEPFLTVLDVSDKLVVPGLIDMHTHLREPGFEYKEDILSGSQAAAAGGFTSVACMPNTKPVNDNRSITEFIKGKASAFDLVNVYPIASITLESAGSSLTEFMDLKYAGAVAFSDDGKPVTDGALMRRALEYASSIGLPIISHCEDLSLSQSGLMNEGLVSTQIGMRGMPSIAEDVMVARDIIIAEYTKAHIHIAHVSTAGAVRLIREAKNKGIKVTCETAPHYFTLTDELLRDYDTYAKVNPPLRTAEDVAAVKEGIRDGTIDAIASDHAPHAVTDKEVEFEYASFGISGLETSLALSIRLVEEGVISINQLILAMSTNPARILNLNKGTLKVGSDADITVIDLKKPWIVNKEDYRSKGKNTPFHGLKMLGKAVYTIKSGKIRYQDIQ